MTSQGQRLAVQPGAGDPAGRFQDAAGRHRRGGPWKYAFIYECVHRHYPDLPEQARPIRQSEAREILVGSYLKSVGAVQAKQVDMLFGWGKTETQKTVHALVRSGLLTLDVACPNTGMVGSALTPLAG